MKLVFTKVAREELRDIAGAMALEHPEAARRWARRIRRNLARLSRWPLSGRMVPEFEDLALREVIVGNYRAVYRVREEGIEILRILDARREFPTSIREAAASYGDVVTSSHALAVREAAATAAIR